MLQPLYGGALARPFVTHHNALDRDLYLRIATELYLKRLIVGGLERVYELGKDFRNEGVSHKHNPEFTMVEWYEAYADYDGRGAAARGRRRRGRRARSATTARSTSPRRGGGVTLRDAIREKTGIDVMRACATATRSPRRSATGCRPTTALAAARRRPAVEVRRARSSIQPTFILDYPKELSPFAKDHRSEPGLVERLEAFAGGMEIANAFTELNDPDEQRARFEAQQRFARRAATRRRSRTTRRSSRRSSRGCRRPAAWAWGSTGSSCS